MLRKLIVGIIVVNFLFILASVIGTVDRNNNYSYMAIADNDSMKTFSATATVPTSFALNAVLYQMYANGSDIDYLSGTKSNLNFGTLQNVGGTLFGQTSYAVVMYPVTSGRKYYIKFRSDGALKGTNPANMIGNGNDNADGSTQDAYIAVADYNALDLWNAADPKSTQNNMPSGAVISSPKRAAEATSDYTLYTSETAGSGRILRTYLGIGGKPKDSDTIEYCTGGHDLNKVCQGKQQWSAGTKWDTVTTNQPADTYGGQVTFTLTL